MGKEQVGSLEMKGGGVRQLGRKPVDIVLDLYKLF